MIIAVIVIVVATTDVSATIVVSTDFSIVNSAGIISIVICCISGRSISRLRRAPWAVLSSSAIACLSMFAHDIVFADIEL